MNLSRNLHPLNYRMIRLTVLLLLVFAMSVLPMAQTRSAAHVSHFNDRFDFPIFFFNDCTGEAIAFTGSLHVAGTLVVDGAGNIHVSSTSNWQRMQGTGLNSGTRYVGSSTSTSRSGLHGATIVFSEQTNLHIIGLGTAENLTAHLTVHYTIANGRVTALVGNSWLECR